MKIKHIEKDFSITDFDNRVWRNANSAAINKYWSGENAPTERHTVARLLWSVEFLYVRFDCVQKEPLVINEKPDLKKKTLGLWNRDVCEIFIAPNKNNLEKYFEFEVAPTGEWIDLEIEHTNKERVTDWDYESEMETSATIETNRVMLGIKIPWKAFSKKPKQGDIWLGNLFRIVGKGESRGFLAWKPTDTEKPNFHVPERFGVFKFEK